jgi:hypothetical protein
MEQCNHILCADHIGTCAIGGEAVCGACSTGCAICGRPHCSHHTRTCVQCYQEYCSECVRIHGRCDTCATVAKEGVPADLNPDLELAPWLDDPDVRKLIPHYHWRALHNERYTIYFGEGAMFNAAVMVVQHTPLPSRLVHSRRISVVERMRGMLGS